MIHAIIQQSATMCSMVYSPDLTTMKLATREHMTTSVQTTELDKIEKSRKMHFLHRLFKYELNQQNGYINLKNLQVEF